MVRLLFPLIFLSSVFASDIKGVIEEIDNTQKTIKVSGNIIYVLPYTEIEQDDCGSGWDMPKRFADLKVNDAVKIDIFFDNGKIMAKEIEIMCFRAY